MDAPAPTSRGGERVDPRPSTLDPRQSKARAALARYPAVLRPRALCALGSSGGFSGARLWRAESRAGLLCLKAYPPHETRARLAWRHGLMATARAAGLPFVPAVFPASDGETAVEESGALWELAEWLPGRADYRERPSPARLREAGRALARVHCAWENCPERAEGPCPAIRRRLEGVRHGEALLASRWRLPQRQGASDPLGPLVEKAWELLPRALAGVPPALAHWEHVRLRLQPCLCDVWHDHLLFEGERLTGLVDYGSIKVDHSAVDLARMLGSLAGDDPESWRVALEAYREVRSLGEEEEALARALDRTGVALGVVSWLRWLYEEGRTFEDRAGVARRLGELVGRL